MTNQPTDHPDLEAIRKRAVARCEYPDDPCHVDMGEACDSCRIAWSKDIPALLAEVERLRDKMDSHDSECSEQGCLGSEFRAELQRTRDVIHVYEQNAIALSYAIGSPKDVDRLAEVIPLVLSSYRQRFEEAQAERDSAREALKAILAVASDRQAFVMQGPRAFAKAEQIARAALARLGGDATK